MSTKRNALSTAEAILILAAIAAAFFGVGDLTQATEGVGLLALGCFLLILARIVQASL